MKLFVKSEEKEALRWFDEAAKIAQGSLCKRARCGSVIVRDGAILGAGYNAPPQDNPHWRTCLNEYEIPSGFRHDRTCCIHAEQRAVHDALRKGADTRGASIYFVAIDKEGKKLKANSVKCTICSRAALDAGITKFLLYFEDGVREYDTAEFDKLSFEYQTRIKI
jgi:deoxycytidylate deaminase